MLNTQQARRVRRIATLARRRDEAKEKYQAAVQAVADEIVLATDVSAPQVAVAAGLKDQTVRLIRSQARRNGS